MQGSNVWTIGLMGDGGDPLVWWQNTNDNYGKALYSINQINYRQAAQAMSDTTASLQVTDGVSTAQTNLFYPPYAQYPELAVQNNAPIVGFGALSPPGGTQSQSVSTGRSSVRL